MQEVLMYNIEGKKVAGIKLICSALGLPYRTIAHEDYGRPIGVLIGLIESDEVRPGEDFDEEMLYLADIRGDLLNLLLGLMRKRKVSVALKAVKTDTNITFTSYELYRELSAEREALSGGTTAHNAESPQREE